MIGKAGWVVGVIALAWSAQADFALELDFGAKPMKDVRTSTCGPEMGYAGCSMEMGPGRSAAEIRPHTVQTVTVMTREAKECARE